MTADDSWGDEEEPARTLSGYVLVCTKAVVDCERERVPARRIAAAVVVIRDGIAKARKLNADYIASGHASERYRNLAQESELAFERIEGWCASKSGRT